MAGASEARCRSGRRAAAPVTPWAKGSSPVNIEAWEGTVHGEALMATVALPRAAPAAVRARRRGGAVAPGRRPGAARAVPGLGARPGARARPSDGHRARLRGGPPARVRVVRGGPREAEVRRQDAAVRSAHRDA